MDAGPHRTFPSAVESALGRPDAKNAPYSPGNLSEKGLKKRERALSMQNSDSKPFLPPPSGAHSIIAFPRPEDGLLSIKKPHLWRFHSEAFVVWKTLRPSARIANGQREWVWVLRMCLPFPSSPLSDRFQPTPPSPPPLPFKDRDRHSLHYKSGLPAF